MKIVLKTLRDSDNSAGSEVEVVPGAKSVYFHLETPARTIELSKHELKRVLRFLEQEEE